MALKDYIIDLSHGNLNQRATAIALENLHFDGAHHKQWIIDQMLRQVAGSAYNTLVEMYEKEHGPGSWDCGIKP